MSCVIGAVVMLLVQYYAFVRYFDASSTEQEKQNEANRSAEHQRFELPVVSELAGRALTVYSEIVF